MGLVIQNIPQDLHNVNDYQALIGRRATGERTPLEGEAADRRPESRPQIDRPDRPESSTSLLNSITTSQLEKKEEGEEGKKEEKQGKKYFVEKENKRVFEPDFPPEDPVTSLARFKVVKSGSCVEVYEYKRPLTRAVPGKAKKAKRPTEEARVRPDNIYRAKKSCERRINANRDLSENPDKFVTLTFSDSDQGSDLKTVNEDVHKFIKRLEYRLKLKAHYVAVPEIQQERLKKYGVKVWHMHVYFFGLPYIPNADLRKIWKRGFVRINAIDSDSNVGSYISKYMREDFEAFQEKGMKRFYCSSGLLNPEETRAPTQAVLQEKVFLPEESLAYGPVTYENPYLGEITYTRYDLKKGGHHAKKKVSGS